MEQILKTDSGLSRQVAAAVLVNRYATPLALFMVALGILLSQPVGSVWEISIGLLAFSIVFNIGSVRYLQGHEESAEGIIRLRLVANLLVNILLVYYLGGYWTPMWLIMTLTPLATAIYSSQKKTLVVSVAVSAILLAIHSLRRLHSPLEWGEQAVHAAYIILVSLLVNGLTALARESAAKNPS